MDMMPYSNAYWKKFVVKHSLLVFLDGVVVTAKNIFSCLKTCILNEIKI